MIQKTTCAFVISILFFSAELLHAQKADLIVSNAFFGRTHSRSNGNLYVASQGGPIVSSEDNGASFQVELIGNVTASSVVTGLYYFNDVTAVAAMQDFHIYRTTDNWRTKDSVFYKSGKDVGKFINGPAGELIVFYRDASTHATPDIYFSTDNGFSFAPYSNRAFKNLTDMVFMPNGHALAVTFDTLFTSVDSGHTWTVSGSGAYNFGVYDSVNSLYVASFSNLYKSSNYGATWDTTRFVALGLMKPSDQIGGINFADFTQGVVITFKGVVLKTTDGGQNWAAVDTIPVPAGNNVFQHLVATDYPNLVALGTGGMIYHSADYGASWQQRSGYVNEFAVWGAQFIDSNFYYLGTYNSSAFFVTSNSDGSSQTSRFLSAQVTAPTVNLELTNFSAFSKDTIIVTTHFGYLVTTTDGFASRNLVKLGFNRPYLTKVNILPDNKTAFALGDRGALFKTTDQGMTWVDTNNTGNNTGFFNNYVALNMNDGYLLGDSGVLFKTHNQGQTWTDLSLTDTTVHFIDADFTDSLTGYAATFGAIYKTNDGGINWTKALDKPGTNFWDVVFNHSDTGIVTGIGFMEDCNTFITYNGGASWECYFPFYGGSFNEITYAEAENNIYLSGNSGVVRTKAPWVPVASGIADNRDESLSPYSVYPNPATNTFIVEIINENYQPNQVALYDILGNEIQRIVLATDKLKTVIHVDDVAEGMYMLGIKNNSGIYYHRLYITR